jgi:hypothetical protein
LNSSLVFGVTISYVRGGDNTMNKTITLYYKEKKKARINLLNLNNEVSNKNNEDKRNEGG